MSPTAPAIERQKNMRQIESLLYDGVHQAIRSMLPVKNILREYLKAEEGESDSEGEEEEEKGVEGGDAVAAPVPAEIDTAPAAAAAAATPAPAPESSTSVEQNTIVPSLEFTGLQAETPSNPVGNAEGTDIPATSEEEFADSAEEIQIFEDTAGEALDDFEDLDAPQATAAPPAAAQDNDILPMDFEELS